MEFEKPTTEYRASYVWRGGATKAKGREYVDLVNTLIKTGPIQKPEKPVTDFYQKLVLDVINRGKAKTAPVFPAVSEPQVEEEAQIPAVTQPIVKPVLSEAAPQAIVPKAVETKAAETTKASTTPRGARAQVKKSPPKESRFISSKPETAPIRASVVVHSPTFYTKPDQCPAADRKNLSGPFWVVWPKGKNLPPKYKELNKVINC